MINKTSLLVATALTTLFVGGCDDPGGGQGQGGGSDSQLSITLRASNLVVSPSGNKPSISRAVVASEEAQGHLPVACKGFFAPGPRDEAGDLDPGSSGPRSGSCITPVSVTGHVDSIHLSGDYFGGGIRLLGGGSGFGQNFLLEGTVIDLADPLSLGGEDAAQDTAFANYNNRVSTTFNYLDIKFAVPRDVGGDLGVEYWTYRYAFLPYPFSGEPTYTRTENSPGDVTYTPTNQDLATCLAADFLEAGETADANNEDILGGLTGVKTGDILICRKDSATETCQAEDFQWLNVTTSAFVDSRPDDEDGEVFRFSRMANHKTTCESDGPGFSVDLGGFDMQAALYKDIQFSADIDGDSKIYEFQYAGDMDSNKKGSEMYLFIDLDFSNSLLVHDASDINDMTLETTPDYSNFEALAPEALAPMIWFKPIYLWENSSCEPWRPGDCSSVNTGVKANVGVELSGATEHPVFVCEEDSDPEAECVGSEDPSEEADIDS